jgi:hypothetical protein
LLPLAGGGYTPLPNSRGGIPVYTPTAPSHRMDTNPCATRVSLNRNDRDPDGDTHFRMTYRVHATLRYQYIMVYVQANREIYEKC